MDEKNKNKNSEENALECCDSEDIKEDSKDSDEKPKEDFFIGKTVLGTAANVQPKKKKLEEVVAREIFEENLEKPIVEDSVFDEIYVPSFYNEPREETRPEENVFKESSLGNEFYDKKSDELYERDSGSKNYEIVRSPDGIEQRSERVMFEINPFEHVQKKDAKNPSSLN